MSYYGHSGNNQMIAKYKKLLQQQLQESRKELGEGVSDFYASKTTQDSIERPDDRGTVHTPTSSHNDVPEFHEDILTSSTHSRPMESGELKTTDDSQSEQTILNTSMFRKRVENNQRQTFSPTKFNSKANLHSHVHNTDQCSKTVSYHSVDSSNTSPVTDIVSSPNHPVSSNKVFTNSEDSFRGSNNSEMSSKCGSDKDFGKVHSQYNSPKISSNKLDSQSSVPHNGSNNGSQYSSNADLEKRPEQISQYGANSDFQNSSKHLSRYRSNELQDSTRFSSQRRSYSNQFKKVEGSSQNGSNTGPLNIEDISPNYGSNSDLHNKLDTRTRPSSHNRLVSDSQISANHGSHHRLDGSQFSQSELYPEYGSNPASQSRAEQGSRYGSHKCSHSNTSQSDSMHDSPNGAGSEFKLSKRLQNEPLHGKPTECTERVSNSYVAVDMTSQQNSSIVSDDYGDDGGSHHDDKLRDVQSKSKSGFLADDKARSETTSLRPDISRTKYPMSKPSGFALISGYDRHRYSHQSRQFSEDRQGYGDSRPLNHDLHSDLQSELTDCSDDRYENGLNDYQSDTDVPRRAHRRQVRDEQYEDPIYRPKYSRGDNAFLDRSLLTTQPGATTLTREQLEELNCELRSEKEILAREVVMLRESLESSINAYTPNSPLKHKISELENQIDDLQESNEMANQKLYDAEQRINQLSHENKQLLSLREENDQLKQKILDLETRLVMQNSRPVPNYRQPPRYDTIYNSQARAEEKENRRREQQHSSLVEERNCSDNFSSSIIPDNMDLDLSDDGTECLLSSHVLHNVPPERNVVDLPPTMSQSSSRPSRARQPARRDVHRDHYLFKRRSRSLDYKDRTSDGGSWNPLSNLSLNEPSDKSLKKEMLSSYLSQSAGFRSVSPPPIRTQRNKNISATSQRSGLRSITAGLKPFVIQSTNDIHEGDVVKFSRQGGKISQGWVRYVGHLHGRGEVYLGVELDKEEGKHDGVFEGVRYFQCKANKGVFVSFNKVVMAWCLPDAEDRDLSDSPFISTSPRGTSSMIKA